MKFKRKAMFFSVIALLMVTVFLIIITIQTSGEKGKSKIESTQVRIKALNNFIKDLETGYFQSMVDVSSHKAIESLIKYTRVTRVGDNPTRELHESGLTENFNLVFFFGYIREGTADYTTTICKEYARWINKTHCDKKNLGTHYFNSYRRIDEAIGENFMHGFAFFDILNKTENTFKNLGLQIDNFDIEINEEDFKMADPWTIQGTVTLSYSFKDRDNIASWKGVSEIPFKIDIIGLDDPILGTEINKGTWVVDKGSSPISATTWPDQQHYFLNEAGTDCVPIPWPGFGDCTHEASSFFGKLMNDPDFKFNRDTLIGVNLGICPKESSSPFQHPGCDKT